MANKGERQEEEKGRQEGMKENDSEREKVEIRGIGKEDEHKEDKNRN